MKNTKILIFNVTASKYLMLNWIKTPKKILDIVNKTGDNRFKLQN